MKTRRQQTRQDEQRARVKRRRRTRGGPVEAKHGERSQSGVRIRSTKAWAAYVKERTARMKLAEQKRSELPWNA